jgi:hypothetical protein
VKPPIGQKIGHDISPSATFSRKDAALASGKIGHMVPVESVERIEPARLEDTPAAIADVIADLSAQAATLGRALHPRPPSAHGGEPRRPHAHHERLLLEPDRGP